jgi:hypothetical protein
MQAKRKFNITKGNMQSIKAKKRNAIDQRLMSQIKSNLA